MACPNIVQTWPIVFEANARACPNAVQTWPVVFELNTLGKRKVSLQMS